ncbi:hypothetical protein G5I_09381 [Acromyrmex echinatior]|uniref:Uncharacterized protein n=1 Tax=Acromyrmex echinatior TaxID=103372 RepID=F4WU27_ACREC|nr:hypothetical protein G5I_09381 [Acromyrmex echinatior]
MKEGRRKRERLSRKKSELLNSRPKHDYVRSENVEPQIVEYITAAETEEDEDSFEPEECIIDDEMPLSDLTAFFDRVLTDPNTVDTISNDVNEGSVDQIKYTVTVSDVIPVLDSSMVSRKNNGKKNKSSYSRSRSPLRANTCVNNNSAASNAHKGIALFRSCSLESLCMEDKRLGALDKVSLHPSAITPIAMLADKSSSVTSFCSYGNYRNRCPIQQNQCLGSKKSLKRRADKEAPNASANKMQVPSPPSNGTSSFPVKYQHIDSPSHVVYFCRASEIPGKRINALNVSRVLHKAFNHEILEVKSHQAESANAITTHPILKENNFTAFIPTFRVMRTGLIKNVPANISDEEILNNFKSPYKIISVKRLNRRIKEGRN